MQLLRSGKSCKSYIPDAFFFSVVDELIANSNQSPITVSKENPYTFDLGHLMVQDPNPLVIAQSENTNEALKAVARDGAQVLINQLLVRHERAFQERT